MVCKDYICCLYGTPSAYGVVTMPFSVREGINIFLAGFVPTENLRFRDEELNFKMASSTGKLLPSLDHTFLIIVSIFKRIFTKLI